MRKTSFPFSYTNKPPSGGTDSFDRTAPASGADAFFFSPAAIESPDLDAAEDRENALVPSSPAICAAPFPLCSTAAGPEGDFVSCPCTPAVFRELTRKTTRVVSNSAQSTTAAPSVAVTTLIPARRVPSKLSAVTSASLLFRLVAEPAT